MSTHELVLLFELAEGIICNHDDALTETCVFCGCDELTDDPEHTEDCIYRKSLAWVNR